MSNEEPTVSLEVHELYRADLIAFSLTIQNDTGQILPAGVRVQVNGTRSGLQGAAEKPWFTETTPEPLAPGESHRASSSGPMSEAEVNMEFTARLADPPSHQSDEQAE